MDEDFSKTLKSNSRQFLFHYLRQDLCKLNVQVLTQANFKLNVGEEQHMRVWPDITQEGCK